MITFKSFSQYEPEYKFFDAIYLQSEDGLDWFYHRTRLSPDTMKICYDENGIIRMYSYQADNLFPLGLSVTEVKPDKVPEGLNNHGDWLYKNGLIIPNTAMLAQFAENQKKQYIDKASRVIAPLQDAVDLGIASKEEITLLTDWKKYRVLLSRVDTSKAPDIEWPEVPDNVA
ncbi:tail fiber assembly protein [Enterobacter bugandensis]|uniref:tail fiber assembly protein n=1 Tax=Enterobacter bugandensis TaxID=881260 RepID=UPI000643CF4B|nr:tail fiber assembly protein [Enterobacter bugandensis]KLR17721.1 hypothetical protein ABR26_17370 [Enterobacter bugandensis]